MITNLHWTIPPILQGIHVSLEPLQRELIEQRSAWRKLGPITLVDVDDIVGAGAPQAHRASSTMAGGAHRRRRADRTRVIQCAG